MTELTQQDKVLPQGTDVVYKLRVERTKMRNFPFDIVYFISKDRKDLCAKIFPWSLCLPIKPAFASRLDGLDISRIETIVPGRFRKAWGVTNKKADDVFAWEDCFALIPILPLMKKKHEPKKRYAAYIGAPQHAGDTELKFADILDDDTVLFTPQGPVNPVCVRCPLHMLHVQGKCALGSKQCYDELILKGQVDSEQLQDDDAQPDQSA
jgi:hypothetical protein